MEYEIEAEIFHSFLSQRATGPAYNSIIASGTSMSDLLMEAGVWSSLQALSTAVVGVVFALLLRGWLDLRIRE